jgi:hypothetical protein
MVKSEKSSLIYLGGFGRELKAVLPLSIDELMDVP